MKRNIAAVITALFILLAGSSMADPGPRGERRFSPEKMVERISRDIGLTDAQKNDLLARTKQADKETETLLARNRELFGNIDKELAKDSPDTKVVYGYMQQISQNELQMQYKRMEQMIQLRKSLTPEQKIRFEKMREKMRRFERSGRPGSREAGPREGRRPPKHGFRFW